MDEDGGMITVAQAVENGWEHEPYGETCPHCGKPLESLGMLFNGKVLWVGSKPCGCSGELRSRAEAEASARRTAETERRKAYARAGIGKRYMDAKVDRPECAQYLSSFGSRPGQGLYLHGDVGRGKSYAASALAKEFVDAGYRTVFTTTIDMLDDIKETFDNGDSTNAATGRFAGCDVLLLDDLGKESASAWSISTLFQVINARYDSMRPTIITSQYAPSVLVHRLGRQGERESAEAIGSRLAETCDVVRLLGPDRRTGKM